MLIYLFLMTFLRLRTISILEITAQEQLGEMVGAQKFQISRLEKGRRVSISSMARLFMAMDIPLSLEIGGAKK